MNDMEVLQRAYDKENDPRNKGGSIRGWEAQDFWLCRIKGSVYILSTSPFGITILAFNSALIWSAFPVAAAIISCTVIICL